MNENEGEVIPCFSQFLSKVPLAYYKVSPPPPPRARNHTHRHHTTTNKNGGGGDETGKEGERGGGEVGKNG